MDKEQKEELNKLISYSKMNVKVSRFFIIAFFILSILFLIAFFVIGFFYSWFFGFLALFISVIFFIGSRALRISLKASKKNVTRFEKIKKEN